MRSILITLSFLALVCAALADAAAPRRRTRPVGASRPSGGIVERAYDGPVLRVVNAQGLVPVATVSDLVRRMRIAALLPFEVAEGRVPAGAALMKTASSIVSEKGIAAAVVVVEDADLPWMLVAPKSRWTILNVAPLAADGPSPERLAERFGKVLWCAVARTLGAGYSSYPGCVLTPFSTVRELDAVPVSRPCPEPFNKMIDTAAKYGMRTITIASYRTACQQGWAPTPTNDAQRAIWDETHRIPATPLKIEFDPKRGR